MPVDFERKHKNSDISQYNDFFSEFTEETDCSVNLSRRYSISSSEESLEDSDMDKSITLQDSMEATSSPKEEEFFTQLVCELV